MAQSGKEGVSSETFTVLGHRGAKGHAPENTLPSFQKAIELGATMAELDIHLSRDGEVIVMHDATVDRTTDGSGRVIDLSLDEIKRLDAGSWFGPEFQGVRVPTLREVFDAVGQQILINVEIKSGEAPYAEITEKLARLLEECEMVHRVVISTFEPRYLHELRPRLPEVELALLYSKPRPDAIEEAVQNGWQALHPHMRWATREFVDEAHARGLRVRAWNPNEVEEMRPLITAGVDGIGTDFPERLRSLAIEMGALAGA